MITDRKEYMRRYEKYYRGSPKRKAYVKALHKTVAYKEYQRIWMRNFKRAKMAAARLLFGGCCKLCRKLEKLEFAHTQPTKLYGGKRSDHAKLKDIAENPTSYVLLCHECHFAFDTYVRRNYSWGLSVDTNIAPCWGQKA